MAPGATRKAMARPTRPITGPITRPASAPKNKPAKTSPSSLPDSLIDPVSGANNTHAATLVRAAPRSHDSSVARACCRSL